MVPSAQYWAIDQQSFVAVACPILLWPFSILGERVAHESTSTPRFSVNKSREICRTKNILPLLGYFY